MTQVLPIIHHKPNTEFETAKGLVLDFANPQSAAIDVSDIAFGLSRLPRFCGQSIPAREGYSVAMHSIWVGDYLFHKTNNERLALLGLLHDAHEAYTGDLPTPLKNMPGMSAIIEPIQKNLQRVIYKKLANGLPNFAEVRAIDDADKQALRIESLFLKESGGVDWLLPTADLHAVDVPFYGPVTSLAAHNLFIEKFWHWLQASQLH